MITISDVAADKIKEILRIEGLPGHALRVMASDQGCCGPSYEIMIDEKTGEGDIILEKNGARVFVDKATAKTLDGAEIAFVSDERGDGFALRFPNGLPGAGCGCEGASPKSDGGCGPKSGGCGCS